MDAGVTAVVLNSTTGYNTSVTVDTSEDIATIQQVLLVIVFMVVLVFICGGNLLTILAVWRTPALRTVPNMYVVSLAVADFLTGAIIPYYCISFFHSLQQALNANKYLCLFRYILFHICVAESIACMVVISFDRFLFIKYPLHYKTLTSPAKAGGVIAASWIISCLLGSVPMWDNGWVDGGHCDSHTVLTPAFRVYGLVPGFFVCCIATGICYGYIVKKAMRHQREAVARRMSQLAGSVNTVVATRNDWKSVKVFLLVFGVFFVCWCPNFTLLVVGYIIDIPRSLIYFTVVLGFLNSGMNCVIYAWQNQHFRTAFKILLCRGQSRRSSYSSNGRTPPSPTVASIA